MKRLHVQIVYGPHANRGGSLISQTETHYRVRLNSSRKYVTVPKTNAHLMLATRWHEAEVK